ncbi:MAG: hypothetical protein KF696_10435 [Planctomycetes bacterium]|nr:hypothetical protein [Planctomycetota bacterium]MCW8135153.1 hypothetical protein [Planctomycetota bacterium]
MNLFHMFWPRAAHSAQLRDLVQQNRDNAGSRRSIGRKHADHDDDLGTLSMVCVAIVATLIKKGVITETEFQEVMATVDEMDSQADMSLDPNTMRKALGLPPLKRKGLPSGKAARKIPRHRA